MRRIAILAMTLIPFSSAPAMAQNEPAGQVAGSAVGQVGQRQARDKDLAKIEPMARIDSRVQNRVQSRIRNRIDRDYSPQTDASSSFDAASKQARTAGQKPQ